MTTRPGNAGTIIIPTTTLGSAAGRNFPLSNSASVLVDAVVLLFVTTATLSNRALTIQLLGPTGTILWQTALGTAVAPSTTTRVCAGAGVAPGSVTLPVMQYLPLPSELAVPQFSSVQIFDTSNIDPNDTITGSISIAQ